MLKLVSWNVNGLRSVIGKGFAGFIEKHKPDILCLQETKIPTDVAGSLALPYAHKYWHDAEKPGYSGTAVLANTPARHVVLELTSSSDHPSEGRLIAAEYKTFWLVNVYVPNSRRELVRLPYRQKQWDPDFREFLTQLAKKKPVVVCGDFNVAHEEIDLANPASNRRNAGFTDEERTGFTTLLDEGFVDVFRARHPGQPGHYSWWTYRMNARARNVGWRIDYFLVSKSLAPRVGNAFIWPDVTGSDHCPVGIEIDAKL